MPSITYMSKVQAKLNGTARSHTKHSAIPLASYVRLVTMCCVTGHSANSPLQSITNVVCWNHSRDPTCPPSFVTWPRRLQALQATWRCLESFAHWPPTPLDRGDSPTIARAPSRHVTSNPMGITLSLPWREPIIPVHSRAPAPIVTLRYSMYCWYTVAPRGD